jgi:tetratricopeptide (TPR) repeat protein
MKTLAPQYWEQKGGFHPVSVWATGADRHYLAIRADVRDDDTNISNPYQTAYFAYVSMVLTASFNARLPLWFLNGLAGVMSNTVVRETQIFVGPPIADHVKLLNRQARLSLAQLMSVMRSSREFTELERRWVFDAQAWAFLHFLMFGENRAHQKTLGQFGALLQAGKDPDAAFREALGRVEDYETPFSRYISSGLFAYVKSEIDAAVKREGFSVRTLAPAESAATRGAFHVAMRRPNEAQTEIANARKADPSEAESYVAEGLLLDRDGKREEAKAAFAKAIERNSSSAYAHFRFAALTWRSADPDRDTLLLVERNLARATALNIRYADAYAYLGEVRAALKERTETAVGVVRRAIALEPWEPRHHLSAARVLYRLENDDEARKEIQAALALADDEADRREAERLLTLIEQAKKPGDRR